MYISKKLGKIITVAVCAVSVTLYSTAVALNSHAESRTDDLNDAIPFDSSYNKVIRLDKEEDKEDTSLSLRDIEYDISTMYLNASMIKPKEEEIVYEGVTAIKSNVSVIQGLLEIPKLKDSSFKGYMCMHKVTNKSSYQYKFLHSGNYEFYTDSNGIMMYDGYYVVAMGSYYTDYKVGSTFRVTLDSGTVFDCITGDEKSDNDTDSNRMYRSKGVDRGEIIEFLIACGEKGHICNEYNTMNAHDRGLGNLSSLGFQGNISKIEKLNDYSVSSGLYS